MRERRPKITVLFVAAAAAGLAALLASAPATYVQGSTFTVPSISRLSGSMPGNSFMQGIEFECLMRAEPTQVDLTLLCYTWSNPDPSFIPPPPPFHTAPLPSQQILADLAGGQLKARPCRAQRLFLGLSRWKPTS